MSGRVEVCLARPRSSPLPREGEDEIPSALIALAGDKSVRLTKGERRLIHTLMDIEEDDRLDYAQKPTEMIVERLMKLGFIRVEVTEKGRAHMREE